MRIEIGMTLGRIHLWFWIDVQQRFPHPKGHVCIVHQNGGEWMNGTYSFDRVLQLSVKT